MKKKKILLFLGNGFSQGFNFPSMHKLWDICLKSDQGYYAKFLKGIETKYPLSYFISNGIHDIELLLTIWESYYKSHEKYVLHSTGSKSGRGNFQLYVDNMCNWLLSYTHKGIKLETFVSFKKWLKVAAKKYELNFITTNYDLLLEKALIDNSLSYHFVDNKDPISIPLRKLHGSISWFSSSHGILRENDDFKYKSFFKGKAKNSSVYDFTTDCLSFPSLAGLHMQFGSPVRSDNVVPISTIIPPFVGKKYNELFAAIVHSMQQDFKEFDHLVIIGYSFPDADPVVKDIVANYHLKYKTKNSKVIYINRNNNDCQKVSKLFSGEVAIINEEWSTDHLERLL